MKAAFLFSEPASQYQPFAYKIDVEVQSGPQVFFLFSFAGMCWLWAGC
jgi:hypothetical protein